MRSVKVYLIYSKLSKMASTFPPINRNKVYIQMFPMAH